MSSARTEILREARRVVERGWCQHVAHDQNGNACLLGALDDGWAKIYGDGKSDSRGQWGATRQLIEQVIGINFIKWNDTPDRTKDEVLEVLDKAIHASVFLDAADRIRRNGLLKNGHFIEDYGNREYIDKQRVCAYGAVSFEDSPEDYPVAHFPGSPYYPIMQRVFDEHYRRTQFDSIQHWNDASERTDEDVIAFLELCAKEAVK